MKWRIITTKISEIWFLFVFVLLIWINVKSAIDVKTLQLHLLFNICLWNNHMRRKTVRNNSVSRITRIAPSIFQGRQLYLLHLWHNVKTNSKMLQRIIAILITSMGWFKKLIILESHKIVWWRMTNFIWELSLNKHILVLGGKT